MGSRPDSLSAALAPRALEKATGVRVARRRGSSQRSGASVGAFASTTATSQPLSKQELYDRIRAGSKDDVIIDEMIRLGFWPAGGTIPHDPAEDIRRRSKLEGELRALRTEQARLYDEEKLLAALRKQRLEESKRKQKETKERHERERKERAAKWAKRKESEILYVGSDLSQGLTVEDELAETKDAQLQAQKLPVIRDAKELATLLEIDVATLRFLVYDRKVSKTSHYVRFGMPKKTGGVRTISAPMEKLKAAQHLVLEKVLRPLEPGMHQAAHGFRTAHSIVTNAKPHVGKKVVVNVDLQDFFPTVTVYRVRGLFHAMGYSLPVATLLALLCTEPDVVEVELDGTRYFVQRGDRRLPQGAPTSPAITNLLCQRLDRRAQGCAAKLGFHYTRYADDLTFSGDDEASGEVSRLLWSLDRITREEGFVLHPDKTRVMRKGRRQEVTGVVVNERMGVERKQLRKFAATLFQIEKDGPAGKRWNGAVGTAENSDTLFASLHGFASFVHMVDPEKGRPLLSRVDAILKANNFKAPWKKRVVVAPSPAAPSATPAPTSAPSDGNGDDAAAGDDGKKKNWWKVF